APRQYVANLHVHTTFSDGSGSVAEVIEAAQQAGLDILIINDHDTLEARNQGLEGYHGRLLVLVGCEISGRHNHYLAFGLSECPDYDCHRPQDFIDRVKSAGGVGFLAHPFEEGSPLSEGGRAFTWEDWSVTRFEGLEIWNYTSAWKSRAVNWPSALYYFFRRTGPLPGPDPATLAKWDELCLTRRTAGIGGTDAHAFKATLLGPLKVRIFPYDYLFKTINTHLLLPAPLSGRIETDREAVYQALSEGACFVAHDRLHRSDGFDFHLENQGRRRAEQGQETDLQPGDALAWSLPAMAEARLIRNGRIVLKMTARNGRLALNSPGVYRVEIHWRTRFLGPRPWIFSNPIYLRD
ncbi:MAG: CehA/McbA family metallohydrolase, partial [Proteobacteria bacterium]|nr:CehA/McbA family metallohydrolase [Pseudomonadota bacterium]